MKTVLITAYAINPYKGSEDGMGWQFVLQAARFQRVVAVTRRNNLPHINTYIAEHPELKAQTDNIVFRAVDWPGWMLFWKKGPLLSLIYFYCWQISVALRLFSQRNKFDVVHNLNFHNDWTPSFLWILGRPLVWGPVGHHPPVRSTFLRRFSRREKMREYMLRGFKWMFWNFDPFLKITRRRASHVFCMHKKSAAKLPRTATYSLLPSVATEAPEPGATTDKGFTVFSAGRFVPLKGFDITVRSFAAFCRMLGDEDREKVKLRLAGTGPMLNEIERIAENEGIREKVEIIAWIPRHELGAVYRSSSVFLFPSHEGAGMVVAEAMSYALPVVCWDNCGPGAFLHPQATTAVPVCSYRQAVDAFATQLFKLFTNKQHLLKEQHLAAEQYQKHFRWEQRGEILRDVYTAVINKEKINSKTPAHEIQSLGAHLRRSSAQ
ncbi:MAG: glycosyltransferase family 4 protein [Bacteroidetes bacterium]|nr:glycosyltransferase family 4 protein [Bacteroidota bacterium]